MTTEEEIQFAEIEDTLIETERSRLRWRSCCIASLIAVAILTAIHFFG